MGLDMYLYKEIYIGGDYKHRNVKGNIDISIEDKKLYIMLNQVSTIDLKIGYWRKTNHIHKWFVDNVQDGVDECQKSYVELEKLKKLKFLCEKVLTTPDLAPKFLPTQSGFFFGSTEYDEYYFQNIKDTIEILKKCLEGDNNHSNFYYQSSW